MGLLLVGLGVASMSKTSLGMSPIDVLFSGVSTTFRISYGTSIWLLSILFIIIAAFYRKAKPHLLCLGTSFILGVFVDLWNYFLFFNFTVSQPYMVYILLFTGLVIAPMGIALHIVPNIAPSAADELILALSEKFSQPIGIIKYCCDFFYILIGYLLKGQVGIGTILTLITTGFFLQVFYNLFSKLYNKSSSRKIV